MDEEEIHRKWKETPMLEPRIRKVAVNMAVGKSGEPLEKAGKVLQELTNQATVRRNAKQTVRDFGIRKGEPIACLVSLRKEKALTFLAKALRAVDNRISRSAFDVNGNFSFGIKEHIEIPGTKYVPQLGIFGMDVAVAMGRAGFRVKERRRARSKIGTKHLLTPEEAMVFIKDSVGAEIV